MGSNKMNGQEFDLSIESKLGNYRTLPSFPFKEDFSYAIFPGAEDGFVNEKLYKALLDTNAKFGASKFFTKPHFAGPSEEHLFLKQEVYNWKAFNEMQDNHLACEGIYIAGDNYDWLGIYHYNDYLIIGGSEDFIEALCNLVYEDTDWKKHFSEAFQAGEMSMYQSDYDALVEKLF